MKHKDELDILGRKVTVYLPPSYHLSERHYPVVYVHDGGQLIANCQNYLDRLFREGLLTELILVGVHTDRRTYEYTPWVAPALKPSFPDFGGQGKVYIHELADQVKPHLDQRYRTLPEAESTGMIGGSLGGLVTMCTAYWRADVFGRLGMLSPSCWYKGLMDYIEAQPAPASQSRLYVSVGNREGFYKHNEQQAMVKNILRVCQLWQDKRFPDQHLLLDIEDGGTHDLMFMTQYFVKALQFLFPQSSDDSVMYSASSATALAQQLTPSDRYAIPGTTTFVMRSKQTGLEYQIFVYLPVKPPSAEGYAVLYTVDGNAYFGSIAEAMRLQTRHPRGLPSGMIVSIGYVTDEPFVSERRFRDLTVPDIQSGLRPDGTPWPCNGGADDFLDFIEQELMPEIQRRYPVNPQNQGLFGHSLGGFFTLYTLITRPSLFQTYIAGSPSFWWKDRVLFDLLPALENTFAEQNVNIHLMLAIGTDEHQSMLDDTRLFYEKIKPYQNTHDIRLKHIVFEGEGHMSVLHPLISPMIRFMFAQEGVKLYI